MSTNNAETKESVPVSGEPPRKANARAQKPRVAPPRGRREEGHPRQEGPQSAQSRQTGEAGGKCPRRQQDRQGSGPAQTAWRGHSERVDESHGLAVTFCSRLPVRPRWARRWGWPCRPRKARTASVLTPSKAEAHRAFIPSAAGVPPRRLYLCLLSDYQRVPGGASSNLGGSGSISGMGVTQPSGCPETDWRPIDHVLTFVAYALRRISASRAQYRTKPLESRING